MTWVTILDNSGYLIWYVKSWKNLRLQMYLYWLAPGANIVNFWEQETWRLLNVNLL